jgi:hypothetical protein
VPRSRLTRSYVWSFYHGAGRTQIRMDPPEWFLGEGASLKPPRWLLRRAVESRALAFWRRLTSRGDWVGPYVQAALYTGYLLEARQSPAKLA